MKLWARYALLATVVALGSASAVVALDACSSENFSDGDSGADAADAQTTDGKVLDGSVPDGGDGSVDAAPKAWCAENGDGSIACADFDTIDAMARLSDFYWSTTSAGAGNLALVEAPDGGASALSAPTQLLATVSPSDAGISIRTIDSRLVDDGSHIAIDFMFLPPSTSGSAAQVVEFASVDVIADPPPTFGSLHIAIGKEGPIWQLRLRIPNNAGPIPILLKEGVWHRIQMVLDKTTLKYQLIIDGSTDQSGNINNWPVKSFMNCHAGLSQQAGLDTAQPAYYDNALCTGQ
ncbi:hypothetical protein BH09MYX1_BH09MYX1_44520 [soil metagenome]